MTDRGAALVTGSGRGIGLAISRHLSQAGFKVAMVSLESPAPKDVQELLAHQGCRYYPRDISKIDDHKKIIASIENDLGDITCLVNNAGVTSITRGDMLDLTPESFDRSININLRATFFLTQAIAKRMILSTLKNEQIKTIMTISSVNASMIGENRADYCITKSSLTMLNKLFATRLAEFGISLFEIRPGIIETEMTAPVFNKYDPYIKSGGVPMQRWGQPDDIAKTIVTLATGGIPFATGIHLDVGGGIHMHRLKG